MAFPIKSLLIWILLVIAPCLLRAQDFVEGMKLFNRAEYDTLIRSYIPKFIQDHPEEEGLARYFLGESYYNKALVQSNLARESRLLRQAYSEFEKAESHDDLRSAPSGYYYSARYKMGWCSYRLAELNQNPAKMLERAFMHFTKFETETPDSIKLHSNYMAGNAALRLSLLKLYNPMGLTSNSESLNEITNALLEAEHFYDKILNYEPTPGTPRNLAALKEAARIEKISLRYLAGKWSQVFAIYQAKNGGPSDGLAEQADARFRTILEMGEKETDFQGVPGSILSYINLVTALNSYMIRSEAVAKKRVVDEWNNLVAPEFEAEKNFRRGSLYHSHPDVTSDDFNELAGRYYEAASEVPESRYWLAHLQMILDDSENSRANFKQFVDFIDRAPLVTARDRIIYEDARVRKYLLDFEALYLSNRYRRLRSLAKDIEAFTPANLEIQKRKKLLTLLVNCSLTKKPAQLWSKVLVGSDDEKLAQARSTIMFILPRASLSIGMTREKYLILLNRLFEVTKSKKSDETLFFRGIAKTLEAEIQAHPAEKSKTYEEAAKILDAIPAAYANKNEAEYLKARSLFFSDEFDQAEKLLISLVNEKHYLRALFYLAEIYRSDGEGLAAKKCYQVIINKLGDTANEFDRYWILNARAGFEASNDEGGLGRLDRVRIESVEFQPGLRPNALTYEKLADERFLQQQSARESVDWLVSYGLPKKEIYPSKHRLAHSVFAAGNIFETYIGPIDEIRGPVTSTFRLVVAQPDDVSSETEVWLGDERLTRVGQAFLRADLPLNSAHTLVVRNQGCYSFEQKLTLEKAGVNFKVAVLTKRFDFQVSGSRRNSADEFSYPHKPRWDRNFVITRLPRQSPESELLLDFASGYEMRDYAVDLSGDRILAVSSTGNPVRVYSHSSNSRGVGELELQLQDSLKSPEGIAVDAHGNIFLSDWGNHRILKFDRDGKWLATLGSFGKNESKKEGPNDIKLTFPTRLAILEDRKGVTVENNQYYHEPLLFIADHNGVQVCTLTGEYLDTVVAPGAEFSRGDFYGLVVAGYGKESILYLFDRRSETPGRVVQYLPD